MNQLMHPGYLWLFLLYVPLIAWYVRKHRVAQPSLRLSSTQAFSSLGFSWKVALRHSMFGVRLLAIGCLIIILCRPQTHDSWSTSETEGTDIVVALDVSTSMLARDFKPDRFTAAKEVAAQFVGERPNDNIGFVIFASEAFTQVPMTNDQTAIINAINDITIGVLEDGIATAINRIKSGKAKSKSIILLTDGSNNTGVVAPITAAQIARKYGIKIYTIGVGTNGNAPYPVAMYNGALQYQTMPVVIDEATLRKIASITGGTYFRATGNGVLKRVFKEIDKLEKTRMDVRNFSHTEDAYMPWALLLLLLVAIELAARYTVLRNVP